MKTIRDFLTVIRRTDIHIARQLIDDWDNGKPVDQLNEIEASFQRTLELPFNCENLVTLRNWISFFFAERISHICTDALWTRTHRDHVAFIEEFNLKATQSGIHIVEKRKCVSMAEIMRDAGVIQVTDGAVSLTPKGVALADEVRKEIGDE